MSRIGKYFYNRSLRKFSEKINVWLEDKSGDDLIELVLNYHFNHFSLHGKTLNGILYDIEERYHIMSNYFSRNVCLYSPEIKKFSFDKTINDGDWLSVNKVLQNGFCEMYNVPYLYKKFGLVSLYYDISFVTGYSKRGFLEFIRERYCHSFNIEFKPVVYLSVKDKNGNEYKVDNTLAKFELDLLRNGYSLLREDGSNLIYIYDR